MLVSEMTTPDVSSWAELVVSPLGGIAVLLGAGWALIKGHIRLGREVESLDRQLSEAKQSEARWEALALELLQTTDRAITVASSSVASKKGNGAP